MMPVRDTALDYAQALRNRLFDLPGYMLDDLACRALESGWHPRDDLGDNKSSRRIQACLSQPWCDCRFNGATTCARADCRCGCHDDEEYVPIQGWLSRAQAAWERRAYLDMDKAIDRAYDDAGGL